ncbi:MULTISPECIES: polysaccharide biosynthesis/export family protein [unclassified Brevundimonas]|uniref:polysaccharide biosynthesis/export family protein n=1 Tax=unclassified Brevundimonas TaxID=2622653 RepID=UPI0006F7D704|nr:MULTISPECIES: polysaccharide biosynthesis/export family protein [unclassified Brevundimonas]KQY92135.1 hypothetical protein ASD25_18475 [Brevundimonas sp. Root1423]KRA28698.1 hypothetical protein ASD59_02425 [Brevundimonas sp. Root608]
MRLPFMALLAVLVVGCAGAPRQASPEVATTVNADALQVSAATASDPEYRIGPSDKLNVAVFQIEDLSFEEIFVDASGNLQMPMIGTIKAAGLTPEDLSREMERLLRERYLRNPQVSVTVIEAANQKVTIDGAVTKPGVYQMRGRTTLLQAVAMAEGPTRVANLSSVAVFRTVEGRRMVALFDLGQIRGGQMTDPYLQGDDIVIVDTSRLSVTLREILAALPGLAVFSYL